MEDNETEPSQQNKGETENISPNIPPANQPVFDSEVTDTDNHAVSSSEEEVPPMEEPGVSLKASPTLNDDPLSEVVKDTGISNSSKDILPLDDDGRGDDQQEPTQMACDGCSDKAEDDKIDGAEKTASNEGCGDNSATISEEVKGTTVQDEENVETSANESKESLLQESLPAKQNVPEMNVETIGSAPDEKSTLTSDAPPIVKDNTRRNFWIVVALVAFVAVLSQQLFQQKSPPQKINLRQIDIFHKEMEKVKNQFPSQREELWKRSRIHLQRHFQITHPTEPVSIILTAGVRGEVTLSCLAQSIASALSSALNASALHLDGSSTSSQDSDKVKSDIDSQLQRAFEGGKPIAVIHRFEELPPASTLIFYRYCDHENAAFKKTFLIFTVLLGEEEEIQANIRLSEVEEMVTDHLQKKFLSNGQPTAFDKMDIDKYGGLWSRISHLILPVIAEKRILKSKQC